MKLKGTRRRGAGPREEIGAEHRAGSMQSCLDVLLADAETRRGLARAQAFDLPQCEDDTMGFREAVDRRLEQGPELGREGLVFRIWLAVPDLDHGGFSGFKAGVSCCGAAAGRSC